MPMAFVSVPLASLEKHVKLVCCINFEIEIFALSKDFEVRLRNLLQTCVIQIHVRMEEHVTLESANVLEIMQENYVK